MQKVKSVFSHIAVMQFDLPSASSTGYVFIDVSGCGVNYLILTTWYNTVSPNTIPSHITCHKFQTKT